MKAGKSQTGFTLIEVMLVVAVIGVLGMIGYPAYQNHITRTNRVDMQAQMMQISSRLATYRLANGDYGAGHTNVDYRNNPLLNPEIYGGTKYPRTGDQYYDLAITAAPVGNWVLTVTPIASKRQKGDGIIVLNSEGQRCWVKASTTACVPGVTSNWDGK